MQKGAAFEIEKACEEKLAAVMTRSTALSDQIRPAGTARENFDDQLIRMRENADKTRNEQVAENRKWSEKVRTHTRERDERRNELRKERA